MFIECGYEGCRPPSGGSCLPCRTLTLSWVTDIALLTEGGLCSGEIYKHGPPDGGRGHPERGRTRVVRINPELQNSNTNPSPHF